MEFAHIGEMRMIKLWALISVYNNDETIYDCLDAVSKFCDSIIIIEGCWIGYDSPLHSTDKTMREIMRFISNQSIDMKCQVKVLMTTEKLHQYIQRQLLLEEVPVGDWFLVIDSDEIFSSWAQDTHVLLESLKDARGLRIYSYDEVDKNKIPHLIDLPKIYRKTQGMQYTQNHRYLNDSDGPIIYNPKNFPEAPIFCFLHKGAFKKERKNSEKYKDFLFKFESSLDKDAQN